MAGDGADRVTHRLRLVAARATTVPLTVCDRATLIVDYQRPGGVVAARRHSRRPGDRWRIDGPYVEGVWVEILGPAATTVARRVSFLLALADGSDAAVPIEALTSSIGLSPRRVVEALRPLHHYGLIEFAETEAIIGVSGVVSSLSPLLVLRLSRYPVEVLTEATGGAGSGSPAPAGRGQRRPPL